MRACDWWCDLMLVCRFVEMREKESGGGGLGGWGGRGGGGGGGGSDRIGVRVRACARAHACAHVIL